jgi:hypothetical protein
MNYDLPPNRDEILAYEAHLLIRTFGAISINNSITQMQIKIAPYEEFGTLYINFGNYPQSPPILGLSEDIRPFFSLSFALESVKNWDMKNAPHIKDIVNEFLQKLNNSRITEPQLTVLTENENSRITGPQLTISTENEILDRLEKSIKLFFQQRMNMTIRTSVFYCETEEEFRLICQETGPNESLEKERPTYVNEFTSGIHISGKGVFINKARIRNYSLDTYSHYFSETSTVLVHELIGHAYLHENTAFCKLITGPITMDLSLLAKNPSIRMQARELLYKVAKFTQEGWPEWIRWFFDTQYDDLDLQSYVLSKNERQKSAYYDLKTFTGFVQAFLIFVETGHFDFEPFIPPFSFEEMRIKLKQDNISLDMIRSDFEIIIHLLKTLLQDFSDFSEANSTTIMNAILTLSELQIKYKFTCPILIYSVGFLILKQVMEKFSPLCIPELLKIVLSTHAQPDLSSILTYYGGKVKNWPDVKLALLLAIPVTPSMRIDVQHCKMVVEKYLL